MSLGDVLARIDKLFHSLGEALKKHYPQLSEVLNAIDTILHIIFPTNNSNTTMDSTDSYEEALDTKQNVISISSTLTKNNDLSVSEMDSTSNSQQLIGEVDDGQYN